MNKRLELFDKLIAQGSEDPFHHYGRAMELRSLERYDDAYEALCQLAERSPEYVPTYLIAAQLADQLGKPDETRDLLERGMARAKTAGDEHALSELTQMRDGL